MSYCASEVAMKMNIQKTCMCLLLLVVYANDLAQTNPKDITVNGTMRKICGIL